MVPGTRSASTEVLFVPRRNSTRCSGPGVGATVVASGGRVVVTTTVVVTSGRRTGDVGGDRRTGGDGDDGDDPGRRRQAVPRRRGRAPARTADGLAVAPLGTSSRCGALATTSAKAARIARSSRSPGAVIAAPCAECRGLAATCGGRCPARCPGSRRWPARGGPPSKRGRRPPAARPSGGRRPRVPRRGRRVAPPMPGRWRRGRDASAACGCGARRRPGWRRHGTGRRGFVTFGAAAAAALSIASATMS